MQESSSGTTLLRFMSSLEPSLVGTEACSAAHDLPRRSIPWAETLASWHSPIERIGETTATVPKPSAKPSLDTARALVRTVRKDRDHLLVGSWQRRSCMSYPGADRSCVWRPCDMLDLDALGITLAQIGKAVGKRQ